MVELQLPDDRQCGKRIDGRDGLVLLRTRSGRWQQSYVGNSTQETTDYVGGLLEVVSSGGVTDYRHYINTGGEQIAVYSRKSNGTNTFSYLLSDHQASVASITNISSGGVVVGENFTPFGSRRNPRLPGRSNRSAEPGRRADDCHHPRYSSDSRVGRGTVREPGPRPCARARTQAPCARSAAASVSLASRWRRPRRLRLGIRARALRFTVAPWRPCAHALVIDCLTK
jgi:hypothetical protein